WLVVELKRSMRAFLWTSLPKRACVVEAYGLTSEHPLLPGFGSGLVAVQEPDFGPQMRSVMSSPNDSAAEDRDSEFKSRPKLLLHPPGGAGAGPRFDEPGGEGGRFCRGEPQRTSRDLLLRGIAYRRQELKHGGLCKTPRRKLKTLAKMFQTTGQVGPDPG